MTSPTNTGLLELAGAPSIPGLSVRRFRDASDFDRLSELTIAANLYDGVPWLPTPAQVKEEMEVEGLDLASDVLIVEADGQLIGATQVDRVTRDEQPVYEVWGVVLPAFRRRGLGASLLAWNLRRVHERVADKPSDSHASIGSFADEVEVGHRALLAANGYEPIRHFFLMRRTLLADIPEAPLPDGLEIRPVTPDQHRTIHEAEHEAFQDHWGHREWSEQRFEAAFARPDLDTGLWLVAWDGDQVAGVVENAIYASENERLGVNRGWLDRISVRRPWRRRGLARALTAASLVRLREAGVDEGMLGVDSENPTGALGLYEGLGFEVHSRAAAYRRELDR